MNQIETNSARPTADRQLLWVLKVSVTSASKPPAAHQAALSVRGMRPSRLQSLSSSTKHAALRHAAKVGGGHSRGPVVDKEPGAGERGQQPQVVGPVFLDELALHLLRGADDFGFPLKRHLAPTDFTEDLWPPHIGILVALEDNRRRPVAVGWGSTRGPVRPSLSLARP